MSKFLVFEKQLRKPGNVTDIFHVRNKLNGTLLGWIHWYGGFRKYVFAPHANMIFDKGCLDDISLFLENLMVVRKQQKEATNG